MSGNIEKHQSHRRNPSGYLDEALGGVVLLLMKEFAPLPDRLRSALGRVKEVPRVLTEAEQNIAPTEVPRVWAETTLEQAQQAPGLFLGLLPAMAAQAAPDLQADLTEAGQAAADAIQGFISFLEEQVSAQGRRRFSRWAGAV